MKCPYCNFSKCSVLESRDSEESQVTRRRRQCLRCKKRFTTYERVEVIDLKVIKKDNLKEDFSRRKLREGILLACEKRQIDNETIQKLIDDIEIRLLNRKSTEVSSADIGRMVLTRLKKLDQVAYLRYASVFLEFESIEEFKKQIQELK
jgi:transcriptional repressor NrdR